MGGNTKFYWVVWGLLSVMLAGGLAWALSGPARSVFLIGQTTHGHYQIELACESCHVDTFGGMESIQQACVDCHGAELAAADDSHPRKKFTDPRNADKAEILDARYCVTCHTEHRPEQTHAMGVTLPDDYCVICHAEVGEERPTHQGLEFTTCTSSGCHNFHDNTALYEDFLARHLKEPAILEAPFAPVPAVFEVNSAVRLTSDQADSPPTHKDPEIVERWAATGHAAQGINCSDCHQPDEATPWNASPGYQVCGDCHEFEQAGFLAGKHGMRLAAGLSALQPGMARQPMRLDSLDRELGCQSCHGAHDFDTRQAAVESCESCHDDQHTRNFRSSKHFELWQAEQDGRVAAGAGVSCATCHMPREVYREQGVERVRANHHQSHNLRPNEKMLRDVCMDCHGLGFAIDALADPSLIARNFNGQPSRVVESMTWVAERLESADSRERSE
ncbi:MAG: cytochrome c3 family protein [Pseudomonadota bacterium]|nr:cytochrome c3 family protein [Pseudomonadota bacterium]